jgi:methyl-accepting chemotaxis protein
MIFSNVVVDLTAAQLVGGSIIAIIGIIIGYLGLRNTIRTQVIASVTAFASVLQQDNDSLRDSQFDIEGVNRDLQGKIEELRTQLDTYIESNHQLSESNKQLAAQLDQVSKNLQDCLKFRRSILDFKEGKVTQP